MTKPSHFLDGSPIPDDYLKRLDWFFRGVEEITEQDEVELFDFVDGRYVPKGETHDGHHPSASDDRD